MQLDELISLIWEINAEIEYEDMISSLDFKESENDYEYE